MLKQFGFDLREARRELGLAFSRFARLAGYSEGHLRSVENGRREVTADVAAAYDRVLHTGGTFAARHASIAAGGAAESAPWGKEGTSAFMTSLLNGSDVNRRSFVASGVVLPLATRWAQAVTAQLPARESDTPSVSRSMALTIEERLGQLRSLDDELGSGEIAALARNELALVARLLSTAKYAAPVGRKLYSLASEAGRQIAWASFDQHRHGVAQRYFELALRASATAEDPVAGAYALSFLAVQCYSTDRAQDGVDVLDVARSAISRTATPRMLAMLAARSARCLSKTGDKRVCARKLDEARDALSRDASDDEPAVLYWVTPGEIEMIAGSCALDLGDPAEAIRRFSAAASADYRGDDQYPRSHAIYLARAAEAHLALGDIDGALANAWHAWHCLSAIDSVRSVSTLDGLRSKLAARSRVREVREFLDAPL